MDSSAVIQGFGNAGYFIARLLHEDGWKILAVSDSSGAVYCPQGLDPEAVKACKEKMGQVVSYAEVNNDTEILDNEGLLALECDLLVPAALEDQIHSKNAQDIRSAVILELANGPVTSDADCILNERGIVVIPDILANAGGVTVSYFEWVQNRQGFYWTLEEVQQRLRSIMEAEGMLVWNTAKQKNIPMRTAAYVCALERLSEAIEAHGTETDFNS